MVVFTIFIGVNKNLIGHGHPSFTDGKFNLESVKRMLEKIGLVKTAKSGINNSGDETNIQHRM